MTRPDVFEKQQSVWEQRAEDEYRSRGASQGELMPIQETGHAVAVERSEGDKMLMYIYFYIHITYNRIITKQNLWIIGSILNHFSYSCGFYYQTSLIAIYLYMLTFQ